MTFTPDPNIRKRIERRLVTLHQLIFDNDPGTREIALEIVALELLEANLSNQAMSPRIEARLRDLESRNK